MAILFTSVFLILAAILFAFVVGRSHRTFTARVRVVDGDTLAMGSTRIRILGIDAPEMDTQAGVAARRAMMDLIQGRPVRIQARGKDVYGRLLARATTTDGRDIAKALIASGHAAPRRSY